MQISPSQERMSELEASHNVPSSNQSNTTQRMTHSVITDLNHDLERGIEPIDNQISTINFRAQRDAFAKIVADSADAHMLSTALIIAGLFGIIIAAVGTGLQEGGKASSNPSMQWSGTGLIAAGLFLATVTGVTSGVKGATMAKSLKNSIQAHSNP